MDDFSDKQLNSFRALILEAFRLNNKEIDYKFKANNEQLLKAVDDRFKVNNEQLLQAVDNKFRINTDMIRQEIRASETRVKIELRQEMAQMKDEVVTGVAQILDNHTLPTLDNHEVRLTRLETQLV